MHGTSESLSGHIICDGPHIYVSLPILKCGVDLEIIGDLELTLGSF